MLYIKAKAVFLIMSLVLIGCAKSIDKIEVGQMDYASCKSLVNQNIRASTSFDSVDEEANFYFTYINDFKNASLLLKDNELSQTEDLDKKVFLDSFPHIDSQIDKLLLKVEYTGVVSTLNYTKDNCGIQVNLLFSTNSKNEIYQDAVDALNKQQDLTLSQIDKSNDAVLYKVDGVDEYIEVSMKNSNEFSLGYTFFARKSK